MSFKQEAKNYSCTIDLRVVMYNYYSLPYIKSTDATTLHLVPHCKNVRVVLTNLGYLSCNLR